MAELQDQVIQQHCKTLRMPTIANQFVRLTDRAHIITTGTDSYRFRRTTAQRKAGKP